MKPGYKGRIAIVLMALCSSLYAQTDAGNSLPEYHKSSGISGNLSIIGSDSLANLMTLWGEEFKRLYPSVNIQIQAAGSSTAPPALSEGTANIGTMSRLMKDQEIEAFESRHGYKPTPVAVAIDALSILVNKDNPIEGLTLDQVDAVFSATRICGSSIDVATWGQLGLEGAWNRRDIQLYGRNSVSGTYGFFKSHAMCNGDFKNSVNEQPGSASVVQSVSASLNGIGYSGMGYTTSSVRAVPLSRKTGTPFIEANPENAVAGTYPLSRFLYVYINKHPLEPLEPITLEFLKMVHSTQGQTTVLKDGYVPLPARVSALEREKFIQDPPAAEVSQAN